MTDDKIAAVDLPDEWTTAGQVFDAVCEECDTAARFETHGERSVDDRFHQRCYSCNSGRFPGLGETTRFRVTELDPDPDSYPGDPVPDRRLQYSSDDPDR